MGIIIYNSIKIKRVTMKIERWRFKKRGEEIEGAEGESREFVEILLGWVLFGSKWWSGDKTWSMRWMIPVVVKMSVEWNLVFWLMTRLESLSNWNWSVDFL